MQYAITVTLTVPDVEVQDADAENEFTKEVGEYMREVDVCLHDLGFHATVGHITVEGR
jgi:hypothetical protein